MGKTLKREKKKGDGVVQHGGVAKESRRRQQKKGKSKASISYSNKVSEAFSAGKWDEAVQALEDMRRAGNIPKLGAVQRWVRLADMVGDPQQVARLLSAILRSLGPGGGPIAHADAASRSRDKPTSGGIRHFPPWSPPLTAQQNLWKQQQQHHQQPQQSQQQQQEQGQHQQLQQQQQQQQHQHQHQHQQHQSAQVQAGSSAGQHKLPTASTESSQTVEQLAEQPAAAQPVQSSQTGVQQAEQPAAAAAQAQPAPAAAQPAAAAGAAAGVLEQPAAADATAEQPAAADAAAGAAAGPPESCSPPSSAEAPSFHLVEQDSSMRPAKQPLNFQELKIYALAPRTIRFGPDPQVVRHEVPFVPGAFVLSAVLSSEECRQIIAATEAIGYSWDVDYTFNPSGMDGQEEHMDQQQNGAQDKLVEHNEQQTGIHGQARIQAGIQGESLRVSAMNKQEAKVGQQQNGAQDQLVEYKGQQTEFVGRNLLEGAIDVHDEQCHLRQPIMQQQQQQQEGGGGEELQNGMEDSHQGTHHGANMQGSEHKQRASGCKRGLNTRHGVGLETLQGAGSQQHMTKKQKKKHKQEQKKQGKQQQQQQQPQPHPLLSAARAAAGGDRAAGCVLLADDSLLGPIVRRASKLLPQVLCSGKLAGLNCRLRCYRYDTGNVYRPHVDGAWPGSGVKDGKMVHDAYGDRWSRLTFLVYLNDDFEGGSTTFFTPAPDNPSALQARGVQPVAGNVLCFTHGDTASALVHEGSAVKSGKKYVIRTDVLYTLSPTSL